MATLIDLTGQRFGRLIVLKEVGRRGKNGYDRYFLCRCDCGKEKEIYYTSLRKRLTQSCGCIHSEMIQRVKVKHGFSRKGEKRSSEYGTWVDIRSRCYNANVKGYKYYGGRGIKVCDRWIESFSNFLEDMGLKPSKFHSIERDDVNGNYEPKNCYWGTEYIQVRNKTNNHWLEYKGQRMIIADWCRFFNISECAITYHLNRCKYFTEIYNHFIKNKNGQKEQ